MLDLFLVLIIFRFVVDGSMPKVCCYQSCWRRRIVSSLSLLPLDHLTMTLKSIQKMVD